MVPSSSASLCPSSSEMSAWARMSSFSFMALQSTALPARTTSMTRSPSYLKWSWRRMPSRLGRWTLPVSDSSSPERIFMKVDLPEPFGPVRP